MDFLNSISITSQKKAKTVNLGILNPPLPDSGIAMVNLKDLRKDTSYQRDTSKALCLKKLKEGSGFDYDMAEHLSVSRRSNGDLYVWDGAHRVLMAFFMGITELPAIITSNNAKQEAAKFVQKNSAKTVLINEKFKALFAADDAEAVKWHKVMIDANLNVLGMNPAGIRFRAIKQFQRNCSMYGKTNMVNAANFVGGIWGDKKELNGDMIAAVAVLLQNYKQGGWMPHLKLIIHSQVGAETVSQTFTSANLKKYEPENIAFKMLKMYNKSGAKNKLKKKKLLDFCPILGTLK